MKDIDELNKKRFLFLKTIYEESNGNENTHFQMYDVGKLLGFDNSEVGDIANYLFNEGLLNFSGWGGEINITHKGVIEVEKSLNKPNEPTKYFLPFNYIKIQHMENSQIQQGNIESNQVVNLSIENKNTIKDFISLLQKRKDELKLSENDESEMQAELSTILSQLESSRPKKIIIKESLFSIRKILEGAAGAVVASELLKYLPSVLALL